MANAGLGIANIGDRTLGKMVTIATLLLGIAIGFVGGVLYHPRQKVQAQAVVPTQSAVKEVAPGVTIPSLASNLILVHEIAADSVVVNGYDLMRMQQAILNYLATRPLAEAADIQNIVNASRATTIYRLAQPRPAAPPQPISTPGKKP